MDKSTIIDNYDILINYIKDKDIKELNFPDFEMSPQGKIHFEEVKKIFMFIDYIFYITLALSVTFVILQLIKRRIKFLRLHL